jgi:hypothetical protein
MRGWRSIRRPKLGAQARRRRTVDATSATETLSARHDRSAASKYRARLSNVRAHGARVWRKVTQEPQGIGVRGVVVRRGTRLE